jgi:hypothetical protein
MADYTVKRFDEMEPVFGGFFLRTRASLGVSSFGMQILNFPPNGGDFYPNHDHGESGQEEVYLVLTGNPELSPEWRRLLPQPRPRGERSGGGLFGADR